MLKNSSLPHTFPIPTLAEYKSLEKKILQYFNNEHDPRISLACDLAWHLVFRKNTTYAFSKSWETDFNLTSLLLPLILWGEERQLTVVCSAYDLTLLSQLHSLGTHLVSILRTAGTLLATTSPLMIRGQRNYICADRAKKILPELGLSPQQATQHFGERHAFSSIPDSVWKRICVSGYHPDKCRQCQYSHQCGYFTLRQRILTARFLICSQDLLTHDLLYKGHGHPVLQFGRPMAILSFNGERLEYSIELELSKTIRLDQLRNDLQSCKTIFPHNSSCIESSVNLIKSLSNLSQSELRDALQQLLHNIYTLCILLEHRPQQKATSKLISRLQRVRSVLAILYTQDEISIQLSKNKLYILPKSVYESTNLSLNRSELTIINIIDSLSHN